MIPEIKIIDYTKNPLQKIGRCAGTCYNTDVTSSEKNIKRAKHCINANHMRSVELATVTLEISGISIRLGRELYTHIGGDPTRLQASTRYITYDKFDYYVPEGLNEEEFMIYENTMLEIQERYKTLKSLGLKNDITGYVLPLAMETTIIIQCNARMLENMFHQRTCDRALKEYQDLMIEIKEKISGICDEWKWISDKLFVRKCVKFNTCPEGTPCKLYKKDL